MQASPNRHKAWATSQAADQHPPFTLLEEATAAVDGYQRRRIKIQDFIRHTMLICGADAPPGRAPRGNLARELSKAISSERGKGKGVKGASQFQSDGMWKYCVKHSHAKIAGKMEEPATKCL